MDGFEKVRVPEGGGGLTMLVPPDKRPRRLRPLCEAWDLAGGCVNVGVCWYRGKWYCRYHYPSGESGRRDWRRMREAEAHAARLAAKDKGDA